MPKTTTAVAIQSFCNYDGNGYFIIIQLFCNYGQNLLNVYSVLDMPMDIVMILIIIIWLLQSLYVDALLYNQTRLL